ncbi:MAG TPA: adenylate/guanylate cyclase domain-containing protein [Cyclobacteriaceae bacterium]|nr:adenylate/guanylate cyclase domain-containing protein [Cyclobacteriaceae bacterium]
MEERRLAAIMFTDIVGYTALMQKNEQLAIATIKKYNSVMENLVPLHHGEIVNDYGDGDLCVFSSASEAMHCAFELQKEFMISPVVPLRISLHVGEIFYEKDKVLGDGVNVASRIQSLGQSNSVIFSEEVRNLIKNNPEFKSVSLGTFEFKNVENPLKVFALTNEGLHVPKRAEMEGKLKHKNRWRITFAVMTAMIVFLISSFIILKKYFPQYMPSFLPKSIAVLSFSDMSPTHDQEYLGDGIAEAIINTLSQIEELKVIGRTSSFSFKGSNDDLVTIGRRLGAKTVLEGSVQKVGSRLRITAQLIRASDGSHIWSEQYDRNLEEIFDIQDDISEKISEQIQVNLMSRRKKTQGLISEARADAYEDYLKGHYYWNKLTRESLETALQYFQLSLQKDPEFAPAYAGISSVWLGRAQMGICSFDEAEPNALEATRKANELDSTLAEIHWAKAGIAWLNWDWPSLRKEIKRTLVLNPNDAKARAYGSQFSFILGMSENAEEEMKKALELDPINPLLKALYGMNLMYSGQYDKIITMLEENLKTAPDDPISLSTLRSAYHQKKMFPEAYNTWKKSLEAGGDQDAAEVLVAGYKEGGYRIALQRVAELMVARSGTRYVRSWLIGTLYTRAGMKDEALHWLEKAFGEHDMNMPYLKVDPIFDYMRDDPRYKNLLIKMGLGD